MKEIYYAKKGKRILARLIDFVILISSSCLLFFTAIYPNIFDHEQFMKNNEEILNVYRDSGLFAVDEDGNYSAMCNLGDYNKVSDLYSKDFVFNKETYKDVCLTENLQKYYVTKYDFYVSDYNLSIDKYESDILKIGSSESNILAYDAGNFTFTLIDDTQEAKTVLFFLEAYEGACENLITNSKVNDLTNANQKLMLSALSYILLVIVGFSLIFDLIIPLCSPNNETIGKFIFKLGVISKDGYKLKKIYLVPRWFAYVAIEVILGIFSFGGALLISYTMFLFNKKKRCIHDYFGNSIVIDVTSSIVFKDAEEEKFFNDRLKARGEINE